MSTVPPQAVPSSTGASNPLSNGYYGSFYSLSFDVKFKHDNDTVYLAHCYPFTYTDLCELIRKVCTY